MKKPKHPKNPPSLFVLQIFYVEVTLTPSQSTQFFFCNVQSKPVRKNVCVAKLFHCRWQQLQTGYFRLENSTFPFIPVHLKTFCELAAERSSSIRAGLIWKVNNRLGVSTCGVANLSFLMWFNVAFNGIIPTNVGSFEFESQSESERCLTAFWGFFLRRVNGAEGRRVNKLKHMWTLQSHSIMLFADSLVGLIITLTGFWHFLSYFILDIK